MYKPYIPNENLIFPPNLGDFIPEDAPARLVSEIVEKLDLREVHDKVVEQCNGRCGVAPSDPDCGINLEDKVTLDISESMAAFHAATCRRLEKHYPKIQW